MQKASEAQSDIKILYSLAHSDRTTVFPSEATSDLYARLGTYTRVDIPTIFQSEHFNLMERIDSVLFQRLFRASPNVYAGRNW